MPSLDSSFVFSDQVPTRSEVSGSEGFPEHQSPEQDTAALFPGSDENELEEAAITQEQPAVTEAKTTTPPSEVRCKSSEADRPQDKTSEETIQTALQPDAATDTLSTSPDILATKIAAKPAVDAIPETTSQTKPPEYRLLAPVSSTTPSRPGRSVTNRQSGNTSLELWLQLAFSRDGGVKALALVPERREGMPSQIEMGESRLCEWSDDHYESVVLANIGDMLRQGVAWQGRGDARRWRWTLSGRELYVLTSGDVSGLYPFGSSPRLLLNANHAVLTTVALREEAEAVLSLQVVQTSLFLMIRHPVCRLAGCFSVTLTDTSRSDEEWCAHLERIVPATRH